MRITRQQETLMLMFCIAGSVMALGLVLHYVILPSVPHQERIQLQWHADVFIMSYQQSDEKPDPPKRRLNSNIANVEAPCWLTIQFMVDQHVAKQFVSYVDLPFGTMGMNFSEASKPSGALIDRHPDNSPWPLYIDVNDQNNVFFNESIGSVLPDYSLTYSNEIDPPGLIVYRTVGDGISIGGGFLLTFTLVCFLLFTAWLLLRVWEDLCAPKQSDEDAAARNRAKLPFTALRDDQSQELIDEDASDATYEQHQSPVRSSRSIQQSQRDPDEIRLDDHEEESKHASTTDHSRYRYEDHEEDAAARDPEVMEKR